jgi:hypothetical protein
MEQSGVNSGKRAVLFVYVCNDPDIKVIVFFRPFGHNDDFVEHIPEHTDKSVDEPFAVHAQESLVLSVHPGILATCENNSGTGCAHPFFSPF